MQVAHAQYLLNSLSLPCCRVQPEHMYRPSPLRAALLSLLEAKLA